MSIVDTKNYIMMRTMRSDCDQSDQDLGLNNADVRSANHVQVLLDQYK